MATWAGIEPKKFQDRGYTYQSPSLLECQDMGWTIVPAYKYGRKDNWLDKPSPMDEMKLWCKDNVWWQDYVWGYSEVAFKNPADATMFTLKWS